MIDYPSTADRKSAVALQSSLHAAGRNPRRARPATRASAAKPQHARATAALPHEADVLEGLEPFALDELRALHGVVEPAASPSAICFGYAGPPDALDQLRSVVAVYRVLSFDVPRPKALLGHQHFEAISAVIEQARARWPRGAFRTLRLSAAGADSAVLLRLKDELARRTGLAVAEEGDLLLRLRRARAGWQLLVRLAPRPLATRAWRVQNLPGALNATVAHAMMQLTRPQPTDRVLNVCCGSGTLLIERLALGPARAAIGCDIDETTLDSARANLAASGYARAVQVERWDATQLPLAEQSVDVICADLPFGQRVGSHRDNEELYPNIFAEATRVAASEARMLLISHEIRLLERVAERFSAQWQLDAALPVRVGGMTPRIYSFRLRS